MYVMFTTLDWDGVLGIINAVRQSVAKTPLHKAFRSTITANEFSALRRLEQTCTDASSRYKELKGKLFYYAAEHERIVNFGDDWMIEIHVSMSLTFNLITNELTLEWRDADWEGDDIVPILLRLAVLFPPETPVRFPFLDVDRSHYEHCGEEIHRVEVGASSLVARGKLLAFIRSDGRSPLRGKRRYALKPH